MATVSLATVSRRFAAGSAAVDAVDLDVRHGEFLAVLGPSGSGKTTLLRLVAGFERPDAGRITIGDRIVADGALFVPPEARRIGMVFQSYALWPHMDVRRNVGYPLAVQGITGAAYADRVAKALHAVGLTGYETRRPAELSGGQRQRVALARCLVMEPAVVLLDEPLANLDVHLRASLQAEFTAFHRATGATMIYVTHDQTEALGLADRVAVMDQGRVVQLASPEELYRAPLTPMVAGFVGRGAVVPAIVHTVHNGRADVEVLGRRAQLRVAPDQATGAALVCLRPEDLAVGTNGPVARVARKAFQGSHVAIEARLDGAVLPMHLGPEQAAALGDTVGIDIRDGWVIPARD